MMTTVEAAVDDQVTLTAYADQVRELIHHERNDEAIAICRHILQYYPKYIDAYRQLGEAYLEKGDHEDARDLFFRVLSADPENLVAHIGLAVIFEQEHLANEAIWHMERAYEFTPGNAELQKELLRLYQTNKFQARVTLTPAALARVYLREGLFNQAVQEFRTIVAGTPSRWDIRVALAEALWHAGRVRESAEVAQGVLKSLQDCLKANLIVGAAWKEAGLAESNTYLQRAQALDPLNRTAVELLGADSPLLPAQPAVPPYVPGAASPTPETSTVETPHVANFIEELAAMPSPSAAPLGEEPALSDSTQSLPSETQLPEWLRASPTETSETIPAKTIDQATEEKTESLPPAIFDQTVIEQAPPSWNKEQPATEFKSPEATIVASDEIPAWLGETPQLQGTPDSSTTEHKSETTQAAAEELPAWMQVAPESSKPIEQLAVEPSVEKTEASQLPAWLAETRADAESAPPSNQPSNVDDELRHDGEVPGPQSTEKTETSQLPPWLAEPTSPSTSTPTTGKSPAAEIASSEAAEATPQWLRDLQTQAAPISQATIEPTTIASESRVVERQTGEIYPESSAPVMPRSPAPRRSKPDQQASGYAHLLQARAHQDAHRWDAALAEYDYVVQHAPRLVNEVIPALEALIQHIDAPLEAHRILGDAYSRVDRLAEALERYRFALEHIS